MDLNQDDIKEIKNIKSKKQLSKTRAYHAKYGKNPKYGLDLSCTNLLSPKSIVSSAR